MNKMRMEVGGAYLTAQGIKVFVRDYNVEFAAPFWCSDGYYRDYSGKIFPKLAIYADSALNFVNKRPDKSDE